MLCRADSIGVFQVESRAQVGTLPRLLPRQFYDLVVEIGLIRQNRSRAVRAPVHPPGHRPGGDHLPAPGARTGAGEGRRGIPLFQEQLMQIAMAIGGCTGDDADLLRRAMGSNVEWRRSTGCAPSCTKEWRPTGSRVTKPTTSTPGSRPSPTSASPRVMRSASPCSSTPPSWLKLHYPGAFLAGLLRAQPMGFYSPQSLVADARRHGVRVLRPDIAMSGVDADFEPLATCSTMCARLAWTPAWNVDNPRSAHSTAMRRPTWTHRRDGNFAVRLGLTAVQGIGRDLAAMIVAERERATLCGLNDVVRRTGLNVKQTEALATAGAFRRSGSAAARHCGVPATATHPRRCPARAIDAAPPRCRA